MRFSTKAKVFWPLMLLLLLTDCSTKELAETHLAPPHTPHSVIGDVVRLTLAYNDGAAFGLSFGPHSQRVLGLLGLGLLMVLMIVYRRLGSKALWPAVGLGLIAGGAAGNLWDRVQTTSGGVVDFIDIGVGSVRFWTFNVADIGITCGAVILLFLWDVHGSKTTIEGGLQPNNMKQSEPFG